ncbi:MAG TPA: hypothetical protein VF960_05730 [Chloroflexota bacterium]
MNRSGRGAGSRDIAAPFQWVKSLGPEGKVVLLLFVLSVLRGVLYAIITPPFSAPDEKGHYDYLASLLQGAGDLIQGKERRQPPLYYLLSLPVFAAFAGKTSDVEIYALAASHVSLFSLLAVRVFSAMMVAATVPIAYWTASSLRPGDRFVRLGATTFVALVPAYGWIGASVNNDNLATLLASLLILTVVRGTARSYSRKMAVVVIALSIAGIATKPTTLPIIAIALLSLAADAVGRRFTQRQFTAGAMLGVVLALALLASPAREPIFAPLERIMGRNFTLDFLLPSRVETFAASLSAWGFVYQFKTFWGSFSNDSILMPGFVYWGLLAVSAASVLGLLLRLKMWVSPRRAPCEESPTRRALSISPILILVIAVVLEWGISFSRFYNNQSLRLNPPVGGWDADFALLQGRFLFPAMIPIAFLFAWGLRAVLPAKVAKRGVWVLAGLLIAVDWIALITLASQGHAWQIQGNMG